MENLFCFSIFCRSIQPSEATANRRDAINRVPTDISCKTYKTYPYTVITFTSSMLFCYNKTEEAAKPGKDDTSMTKTEYAHKLPSSVNINGQALSGAQLIAVARNYAHVSLGSESISRIRAARAVI